MRRGSLKLRHLAVGDTKSAVELHGGIERLPR